MKISYGLRRLILLHTLIAVAIGGCATWHQWSYLFDTNYWKYRELYQQLSEAPRRLKSVPQDIGDWKGKAEEDRVFVVGCTEEFRGLPTDCTSHLSQVFRHKNSGEEIVLYMVAGRARDVYHSNILHSYRHELTELGEYSLSRSSESESAILRVVFCHEPKIPDKGAMRLAPAVWLTAMSDKKVWKNVSSPTWTSDQLQEIHYKILLGSYCDEDHVESQSAQDARLLVEEFAKLALPEIERAIFTTQ